MEKMKVMIKVCGLRPKPVEILWGFRLWIIFTFIFHSPSVVRSFIKYEGVSKLFHPPITQPSVGTSTINSWLRSKIGWSGYWRWNLGDVFFLIYDQISQSLLGIKVRNEDITITLRPHRDLQRWPTEGYFSNLNLINRRLKVWEVVNGWRSSVFLSSNLHRQSYKSQPKVGQE